MSAKNKNRKDMKFLKMDMLNVKIRLNYYILIKLIIRKYIQMEFEDGLFDAVIDKGMISIISTQNMVYKIMI